MDNLESMLKICMIGTPIFTILAALCVFGWNYYGLKIKDHEKSIQKNNKDFIQVSPTVQNVYNIGGDYLERDKNKSTLKESEVTKLKIAPTETIIDIASINNQLNPYFKYNNNELDFQFSVNAVGNSIGYILSTTFTLVNTDINRKPIDFKIFKMNEMSGNDLIYKEKPLRFGQQAGNLTEPLLNTLFVVIDIRYTDQAKMDEKTLRKIYSINSSNILKNVPEATTKEYQTINKFLSEEKNTLGEIFKI